MYISVFGGDRIIESRGENNIAEDIIKGTKRRGPSNESFESPQAGGERAHDGKGPGKARKVDGKPREYACLSVSPGRTTESFQRKEEHSVEDAIERTKKTKAYLRACHCRN